MTAYDCARSLLALIPDLPEGIVREDWIDFPTLVCERRWSDGEYVLILAAWDLFNGRGDCHLSQLLDALDDRSFAAVVEALQQRRPSAFTTNLIGAS